MRIAPRLSSSLTFVNEWGFPAVFLAGWLLLIQAALRGSKEMRILAVGWGVACVIVVLVAWPIKRVTIEGRDFNISNYIKSHRVPISHLVNVTESHNMRTPTLFLHFDPPTPFGKRVRIIPPVSFFNQKQFDEVAVFLRSLIGNQELADWQ